MVYVCMDVWPLSFLISSFDCFVIVYAESGSAFSKNDNCVSSLTFHVRRSDVQVVFDIILICFPTSDHSFQLLVIIEDLHESAVESKARLGKFLHGQKTKFIDFFHEKIESK